MSVAARLQAATKPSSPSARRRVVDREETVG
jgi:hypothetical protein